MLRRAGGVYGARRTRDTLHTMKRMYALKTLAIGTAVCAAVFLALLITEQDSTVASIALESVVFAAIFAIVFVGTQYLFERNKQ